MFALCLRVSGWAALSSVGHILVARRLPIGCPLTVASLKMITTPQQILSIEALVTLFIFGKCTLVAGRVQTQSSLGHTHTHKTLTCGRRCLR